MTTSSSVEILRFTATLFNLEQKLTEINRATKQPKNKRRKTKKTTQGGEWRFSALSYEGI